MRRMTAAKRAQKRVGVRSNVAGGIGQDPRRAATIGVWPRVFGAGVETLPTVFTELGRIGSGWRR
ncbi:hypothetical protein FRZ61_27030 [Hypericibacter adhaerens]|uniref:Uncharacterized protein n=1 Tax=Hypericibacter adhaerens TaxID=2602016 RepID=A0A5J6MZJ6_9PROT|nr:hypothetical protein FRZ61_27030 [Hypericibacter adhaerens]